MRKYMLYMTLVAAAVSANCSFTSQAFQNDADIIRHEHLVYYARLLHEYFEARGGYPFADTTSSIPTYVFIANSRQKKFATNPPFRIRRVPTAAFFKEIGGALGRDIDEYYDPQFAPDYKPNFYIYMTVGGYYFFAVHVSKPYPYAKQVGKNYYKIELSNNTEAVSKIITYEELTSNAQLLHESKKPLKKEGFFRSREKAFLHETRKRQ